MLQQSQLSLVTYGIEVVQPSQAKLMLLEDGRGHSYPTACIQALSKEMSGGFWKLNGEAVVTDVGGQVVNGRKRLLACIEAGVSFETVVVRGVDPACTLTSDSRKTRRLSDALSIAGHSRGHTLGSTLRLVATMSDGDWSPRSMKPNALSALLRQTPGIEECLDTTFEQRNRGLGGSTSLHAAVRFILSRIDRASADEFFTGLYAAGTLPALDPRRALARRLELLRERRTSVTQKDIAGMLLKGWNLFHEGAEVSRFFEPESFPEILFWTADMAVPMPDGALRLSTGLTRLPGFHQAEVVLMHVDPELAAEWLATRNTHNRRISPNTAVRYGRDMGQGRWQLNGETLKFSVSGRLLDGQHRLRAIVESGETVTMLVVNGLPEDVFDTLDTGEKRGFGKVLSERGVKNGLSVAAAVKAVLAIEQDVNLACFYATNSELDEALAVNPGIMDSVQGANAGPLEPGHGIALSYLFGKRDAAKSITYMNKLRGIGTFDEKDPMFHLRTRLGQRSAGQANGDRPTDRLALSIAAWNAFVTDRPTSRLMVRLPQGRVYPAIA